MVKLEMPSRVCPARSTASATACSMVGAVPVRSIHFSTAVAVLPGDGPPDVLLILVD
jgi:hypothetical protein